MSVILIGMPSSGKSTVGVILAKRLGLKFIDTDLLIQQATGKLLYEILEERGAEGFLNLENFALSVLKEHDSVIATGGSAVYGEEGMANLKTLGKVVYLELEYGEMVRRLGNYSHRGIAMREGRNLKDMYDERIPLYRRYADITVKVSSDSIADTVEEIVCRLDK